MVASPSRRFEQDVAAQCLSPQSDAVGLGRTVWIVIRHRGDGIGVSCLCSGTVYTSLLRAEGTERQMALSGSDEPISPETVADIGAAA
jgi:hypothetical protein